MQGFGNLGHVVMTELGDRIVLEGVNGVGKTMILTAIRAALEGKTSLPDRPLGEWIKDGHKNAVIKIDLADGSVIKFSIRVVITANDFDLQIKEVSEDGKAKKVLGGPMAFLKTVVNAISFHPQQWRKKSDAEQCEEVFGFFPGLKERLAEKNEELSEVETERRQMLEKAKVLRLDIERAPFTSGLPEKEIGPAELMEKLNAANKHNEKLDDIKRDMLEARKDEAQIFENIKLITGEITRTEEMIAKLRQQVDSAKIKLKENRTMQSSIENTIKKLAADIDAFEIKPTEPVENEIAGINKKNEAIRQNADRKKKCQQLEETELKVKELYRKITDIKKSRTAIMSSVEIPIDGLSIGEACLLYPNSQMDMIRLSALSDGEFWPVACGLVAAFNPRVRIVIIDSLHDLDKKNFEQLCEAAKKYGMQVWIHKTLWDESDAGAGFLIRDGEVVR